MPLYLVYKLSTEEICLCFSITVPRSIVLRHSALALLVFPSGSTAPRSSAALLMLRNRSYWCGYFIALLVWEDAHKDYSNMALAGALSGVDIP